MNTKTVIETYRVMQAVAEALAYANHPAIVWNEGAYVVVNDFDVDLNFVTRDGNDFVNCSGVTHAQRVFDFDVPVKVMDEFVAARMTAVA